MINRCKANPCCGEVPCSGVPLPQHGSGLAHLNKQPAPDLSSENERLRAALERQGDNMAFVLNHMEVPKQWYEKFTNELSEDRTALERKP